MFKSLCRVSVLFIAAQTATPAAEPPCAAELSNSAVAAEAPGHIETVTTLLAGVPAIVRFPPTIEKPPVVLWHGLGPPASAAELMRDLPLDDVPAVKVYLGLPLFGARAPPAGTDSLAQRQAQDYGMRIFKPIVIGAAQELPAVLGALRKLRCLRRGEKIGLFGFSAGGTAALVALMDPRAPVGVAVMVNAPAGLRSAVGALERATKQPYTWSAASRQLAEQSDAAHHAAAIAGRSASEPRALLLFQGADDNMIAAADTVSLDEALRPVYARSKDPRRLRLTVAPGVSHDWADPRTIDQVRAAVAGWFNQYL
jgi:dienelactone hydrolase